MSSPPLPISASPTHPKLRSYTLAPPLATADSTASQFTDSGLGRMSLRTPSPKRSIQGTPHLTPSLPSPSKTTNSISSRLEQLAALAWEAEEDDRLDEHTRGAVQSQLNAIEAQLEGRTRGNEQTSSDIDLSNSASLQASSHASILSDSDCDLAIKTHSPGVDLLTLDPLLRHLTATVASMRLRLSESNHLHNLAMSRLASIARSNIDLNTQLSHTRRNSTALSHSNAALRMRIDELEATTTQQAVAVSAMTGAVAGLEDYVRSSSPRPKTPNRQAYQDRNGHLHITPNNSVRPLTAFRGSGRFRGKYPTSGSFSSPANPKRIENSSMSLDGAVVPELSEQHSPQQTELQEGILAWCRGFRDVEAGWRDIDANLTADIHRSPTRFGVLYDDNVNNGGDIPAGANGNNSPQTPIGFNHDALETTHSLSEEGDSVLFQGDKAGGNDIFEREDEFGEFQSVAISDNE